MCFQCSFSQWEPSLCGYCGVRTKTECTPGQLCPFKSCMGPRERLAPDASHQCSQWAVDYEQAEVRGEERSSSQGETAGSRGSTHNSKHTVTISSPSLQIYLSVSFSFTERKTHTLEWCEAVNHKVFTLMRTCLLLLWGFSTPWKIRGLAPLHTLIYRNIQFPSRCSLYVLSSITSLISADSHGKVTKRTEAGWCLFFCEAYILQLTICMKDLFYIKIQEF